MEMNTVTKEQRIKAIEDSIKHWEEDIVKPLQMGRVITDALLWADTHEYVDCNDESCPLCHLYYDNMFHSCTYCPLISCGENSTWREFALNPCLKTAQAMVYELRAILIMEDAKDE
jgi:hypothetical protein